MAYIVPADISQLALSNAHTGELATLDMLKRLLPDAYTVFHNVHWSRARKDFAAFGEIDFVVVNRAGRCIFIEQKNGALEETADGLFKHYANGSKEVSSQILRNLDNVRDKFRQQYKDRLDVDYLIYCPDHRLKGVHAVAYEAARVVDAAAADKLADRIMALAPANAQDDGAAAKVARFFQNSFDLAPDVHAHVQANEKSFTRLSSGLVDIVDNLDMTPFRLRVSGSPGCGKTIVAVRAFEHAVEAGKRPLLVCFNRSLKEKIKAITPAGGLVETWYGLCKRFLEDCGHHIDFQQQSLNPAFWQELQERVILETVPDDWLFDSLIVDEGQDFDPQWVDILKLFLREDHDALWLEDRDQTLRRTADIALPDHIGFHARWNYRTPTSIVPLIRKATDFAFIAMNELPGMGTDISVYDKDQEQSALAARKIDNLLKAGFKPADIVLLSLRGLKRATLANSSRVGNFTLSSFTGDYDLLGNQRMSRGQIVFDTIHRFKGQQAPAVILTDVDERDMDPDRWERILYTAMTRATVRLDVIAHQSSRFAHLI